MIVDRIENDIAVCEDKEQKLHDIPLSKLPEGLKEGDVLTLKDGKYFVDKELTQNLREKNYNLQKKLFGKK